jgi:hypothetical protein
VTVRTTLKGAGAGRCYTERLPSYYLCSPTALRTATPCRRRSGSARGIEGRGVGQGVDLLSGENRRLNFGVAGRST